MEALSDPILSTVPFDEYRTWPGLSYSSMKDLAVSPLRFWHCHLNPERPAEEPTAEMKIGSALHCAVLEPAAFDERYACEISAEDYDGCLVTMEDLRGWLRDKGLTPRGSRKAEVIAQVQAHDPDWPILDVLLESQERDTAGKTTFKKDDWRRIAAAAQALVDEPKLKQILDDGKPEVSILSTDKETGVPLKARLDWATPKVTLDLKTFSQKRGKSIDQTVADAIFYEKYHHQGYFYSSLRGWPTSWDGDYVIAFVESEEPHEVRIKALRAKHGGQPNLYWLRAALETKQMIRLYAECMDHFGLDKPWRYAQEVSVLQDEEIKGIAF